MNALKTFVESINVNWKREGFMVVLFSALVVAIFVVYYPEDTEAAVESSTITTVANDGVIIHSGTPEYTNQSNFGFFTISQLQGGNTPVTNLLNFEGVNVSSGATINSANLRLSLYGGESITSGATLNVYVSAHAIPSPAMPADTELSTAESLVANSTSASVLWTLDETDNGSEFIEIDIATVINEVLADPSWTEGSSILVVIQEGSLVGDGSVSSSGYSKLSFAASDNIDGVDVPELIIDYTAANQAPVAAADSYSVFAETSLDVLSNDSDPDSNPLTVTGITQPTNATVAINNDNLGVTYTPDAGYTGADSFTYTISDGEFTDTASVTITVTDNLDPLVVDDSFLIFAADTLDVLTNDSDPESQALTIESVGTPQNGTATIDSGQILYTPNSGFYGNDTFSYTVSDGVNSVVGTIDVEVSDNSAYYQYDWSVDRSSLPVMNDYDLTYLVTTSNADGYTVKGDGADLTPEYDATTDQLMFTTDAANLEVILQNPEDPNAVALETANLKYDKAFAWSHSLDDNIFLDDQIAAIQAYDQSLGYDYDWELTIYTQTDPGNNQDFDENDSEADAFGMSEAITLLNDGWAIGHQAEDQLASTVTEAEGYIEQGYTDLLANNILSEPGINNSDYNFVAFAAPAFDAEYNDAVFSVRNDGASSNPVLFNETGGGVSDISDIMHVSKGLMPASGITDFGNMFSAANVSNRTGNSTYYAQPRVFNPNPTTTNEILIFRSNDVEVNLLDNYRDKFDWMYYYHDQNPDQVFWYNTYSHTDMDHLAKVVEVAQFAHDNYGLGTGGNDEMWMSSAEEIYAYLMTRDNAVISTVSQTVLTDGSDPVITGASATASNDTEFTISWNTDVATSSLVRFGPSASIGSSTTLENNTTGSRTTTHSQGISSLVPCTKYYYRVESTNEFGANGTSGLETFYTGGCGPNLNIDATLVEGDIEDGVALAASSNDGVIGLAAAGGVIDGPGEFQLTKLTAGSGASFDLGDFNPITDGLYSINIYSGSFTKVASTNSPVTLTIDISGFDFTGLDQSTLTLFHETDTGWNDLGCSLSGTDLICQINSFSNFILGAESESTTTDSSTETTDTTSDDTSTDNSTDNSETTTDTETDDTADDSSESSSDDTTTDSSDDSDSSTDNAIESTGENSDTDDNSTATGTNDDSAETVTSQGSSMEGSDDSTDSDPENSDDSEEEQDEVVNTEDEDESVDEKEEEVTTDTEEASDGSNTKWFVVILLTSVGITGLGYFLRTRKKS